MKKVILKSVVLLSVFIAVYSCNKEIETSKKQEIGKNEKFALELGKEHNKCLSSLYTNLLSKRKGLTRAISKNSSETLSETVAESVKIMQKNGETKNRMNEAVELLINTSVDGMVKIALAKQNGDPVHLVNLIDSDIRNKITEGEEAFLKKIDEVLTDEDEDLSSLQNRLNQIEYEVKNANFTENEELMLLTAISISRNSLAYWNENSEAWESEIVGLPSTRGWWKGFWKRFAIGDVTCGIIAGILSGGWGFFLGLTVGGSAFYGACSEMQLTPVNEEYITEIGKVAIQVGEQKTTVADFKKEILTLSEQKIESLPDWK